MADPVAWLDHNKVESQWKAWDGLTVRERPAIEQAVGRGPDARTLSMIDRFLGKSEFASSAPADLDHDERGRGTRVDRHEVKLVATDMDVPGQDGPTGVRKTCRDDRLGGITRLLGRRSHRFAGLVRHRRIVALSPYPPRIRVSGRACRM
jgi:hypothetical protein